MENVTWAQVGGWRMGRQGLNHRQPAASVESVVSRLVGLHAQLMSAAELSLLARVEGLAPTTLSEALWRERRLVKTWLMRGTLHIAAATDLPLLVGALSTLRHYQRNSWLKYHGVTSEQLAAIIAGVAGTLDAEPRSRIELADALVEVSGEPALREALLSGWGALLKPASFLGHLCYGPDRGRHVTFVRPAAWLGALDPLDGEEALREVARRFLATFAPMTAEEFGRWLGLTPARAKRLFRELDEELVAVTVEGSERWLLAADLDAMRRSIEEPVVRLLPHFDPYTVAVAWQSEGVLGAAHRGEVYRAQGWISPVILLGATMVGTWSQERRGGALHLHLSPFAPLDPATREGAESEAARVANFFDLPLELAWD